MNKISQKRIASILGLMALLFLVSALRSSAQQSTAQFLITWNAKSYVPPDYTGKAFPTANSPMTASFEIIDQGKLVNLSGQTIYWYLNDALIGTASDKQTATFSAPPDAPGTMDLRIVLPDYQNYSFQEIQIPVVAPKAVIRAPYPDGNFTGTSLNLKGVPYFFNVADPSLLSFAWTVNGNSASGSENPSDLNVTLNSDAPSGSALDINLAVQDPKVQLSSAWTDLGLHYTK